MRMYLKPISRCASSSCCRQPPRNPSATRPAPTQSCQIIERGPFTSFKSALMTRFVSAAAAASATLENTAPRQINSLSVILLRGPNPEFSAAVKQGHHVKQPLIIALAPIRRWRIPKFLDKFFRARIGRREACHGVNGCEPLGVALLQTLAAVQRELATVVCAFGFKKRLELVAQFALARFLRPPRPVHRPVSRCPKRVVAEVRVSVRRTIKVCVIRI